MAENESAAVEQQAEFEYPVTVEDAGPAAKKVSIEIPRERINSKLDEQFKELRAQATIPGFRTGHAPRKLIEKRFSHDVREQVRGQLISESYEQALKKNSLNVIGEPEFADPDSIKIPDEGSLKFTFQVEVQPEFTVPDTSALKLKKPKVQINDENVEQAMTNLRSQQGTLVPVEDRGVQSGDYLFADVHVKVDGNVVAHQHGAQLVARPGRVGGLQIDDLDKQLEGLKPGETKSIHVKAPENFPEPQVAGKDVEIEVKLVDIKRMELAEVTTAFLEDLGFSSEQELRDALKEQMEEKIKDDIRRALHAQVHQYLLDNTTIEVPDKLSSKQTDRIISRRAVSELMRGVPSEQVQQNVERLRGGAKEEAIRELKLFFILQKLATDHNIDVDEAELNGRVAMLAIQDDKRPEKLKAEMQKNGSLAELYVQMREQKAVDKLLETAQIEEVDVPAAGA